MRIACIFCILALPAFAQDDLVFDINATSACVAEGLGIECVGKSANACMDASSMGYSTLGMNECTDRELNWWDARLNEVYRETRDFCRSQMDEASDFATTRIDALKVMQLAWIDFRDAKCAFVATEWAGGSGAGPAKLWCLMEETARQELYLEERRTD